MVFAVQEINRNSSLLPGVKLGYQIMDSCDHVHTSLRALFSLVSHRSAGNNGNYIKENITEERLGTKSETLPSCLAGSPIPQAGPLRRG